MKRTFNLTITDIILLAICFLFAGLIGGISLYHGIFLPDTRYFTKASDMYSISEAPINGYIRIQPTDNSLIITIVDTSNTDNK